MNASVTPPLIEVRDLSVKFGGRDAPVNAVNGVSFKLMPAEVLCLIGESGSGKSVTMRALMGLLPKRRAQVAGYIRVAEHFILALDERRLAALRGSVMAMIFQEPMTALDPVYTVGQQIAEAVQRHAQATRQAAKARALELLQLVKIPSPEQRLRAYPHELSGGMRQRAMIAIALACQPALLLADEPTTALDATVQVQVLILLRKLQREFGMALMFVTHDLGVAAQIADRVAVMYAGRIVEEGSAQEVLLNPRHPYTIGMLASTMQGRVRGREIEAIPGSPPDMRALPAGCSFAPRCRFATASCRETSPDAITVAPGHNVACLRVADVSPSAKLAAS
jgi:peptide/nickel transport system ATP-binding protein